MRRLIDQVRPVRWALLALGLLLAVNALLTPGFFVLEVRDGRLYGVLVDILNHGSRVAIVALAMALVIATGGIDLSIGAVVAVSGAVVAVLAAELGVPWPLAILAALVCAGAMGAWNGVLVTGLKLQPIVATLILMVAGRGIAQVITGGMIITFEDPAVAFIANGALLGLPFPVVLLAVVGLLIGLAARRTALGMFVACAGDNAAAARLAGVGTRGVLLVVYGVCGLCAGIVGLIECSYIKAADANNAGMMLELDAILAVVIGGTSLRGGRFQLVGAVVGAMLMQTLTKTLYMLDVPAEIAPAPKALVVLAVCLIQSPAMHERLARVRGATRGGATP